MATVVMKKPDARHVTTAATFWNDWPETARTFIDGRAYAIIPEEVFRELVEEIAPPLPSPDTDGNYPAIEAGRALVAWGILRDRLLAGLSRTELAKRSKVRLDRLARIERGEIDPTTAEVDRLDSVAPSPP